MNNHAPVAIITGAGSGIGRAVALKLAAAGWSLGLVGRRVEPLQEVASLIGKPAAVFPCDIADSTAVDRMSATVLRRFSRIDALVNAAGINTATRSWAELSVERYRELLAVNLDGAFHCVQAFLPRLRRQRSGTIIFINSEAGLRASPKSGVGYVAAKFGLTGLAQSLNAEERSHGIRACSIFPGDTDTDLLNHRPQPPTSAARARMLQPEDVAACVWLAINLPPRAIVEELVVRPA